MTEKRKKSATDLLQSELHAVSPLPLQVVSQQLEKIASGRIRIATWQVDENTVFFAIRHYRHPQRKHTAEARGRLLRWQGTETRIDADGRLNIGGLWWEWGVQLLLSALILLPFLSIIVSVFQFDPAFALFLLGVIGGGVWALLKGILNIQFFSDQRYRAAKDLDYVFQKIADTLTEDLADASSLRELDGDDELSRLLRQEMDKQQPHIQADGELL